MAANVQVNGGTPGQGTLAAPLGVAVSLADAGGGSPASRLWSVQLWPAPLAAPPTVTTPTLINAGFTPVVDGLYQVTLLRVEADSTTTTAMSVLVGAPDASGNVLPGPGVNEQLFAEFGANPTQAAAARLAGWSGSAAGGTNVLLDAWLRSWGSRCGLSTTNATPAQVPNFAYPLASGQEALLDLRVLGNGAGAGTYKAHFELTLKNAAGVLTAVDASTLGTVVNSVAGLGSPPIVASLTAGSVVLTVTGVAATSINWAVFARGMTA